MKTVFTLSLFAAACATSVGLSRWGGGSCAVAQAEPFAMQPMSAPEWRDSQWPDQIDLYQQGRVIGVYVPSKDTYWSWDGRTWGPASAPPIVLPASARVTAQNYGIDLAGLSHSTRYSIKGKEVSREEVFDAITQGLPDDRNKLRFTAIGSKERTKAIMQDFYADENKSLADACLFASVDPADPKQNWSLRDLETGKISSKIPTNGEVVLYITQPSGKVIHGQDGYAGKSELAAVREDPRMKAAIAGPRDYGAIRKAKPYDPAKDPDLRKLEPLPKPADPKAPVDPSQPAKIPAPAILLGFLALLAWFLRR